MPMLKNQKFLFSLLIFLLLEFGNNHQSNENSNPLTKLCKKGGTAILQRQNLKITDNKVILLIAGAGGINLPHQHYVPPCCLNEFKFQHTVNCLDQLSFDSQRSRKLFHIAFVGDSIMRHQFVSFIRVNIKSGLQQTILAFLKRIIIYFILYFVFCLLSVDTKLRYERRQFDDCVPIIFVARRPQYHQ